MTYDSGPPGPRTAPGKSRSSKIIMVVSILVSVLAIAGSVVVLNLPETLEPEDVAELYIERTKAVDLPARLALSCQRDQNDTREKWGGTNPPQEEIDEVQAVTVSSYEIIGANKDGEHATVDAILDVTSDGTDHTVNAKIPLLYERGQWTVCGKVSLEIVG